MCVSPASNLALQQNFLCESCALPMELELESVEIWSSVLNSHQLWWTWPSLVCGPRTPVNSGSCGEEPSISLGVDSSSSSSSASSGCGGGVRSSLFPEGITVATSIWKRNKFHQETSIILWDRDTNFKRIHFCHKRSLVFWSSTLQACSPGRAHMVLVIVTVGFNWFCF